MILLPPANEVWGKVMLLQVCHSVHGSWGGEGGFSACIRDHMTRGSGVSESRGGLHPGGVGRFPQDTWDTMGYGQQMGGTNPTGMLSRCYNHFSE